MPRSNVSREQQIDLNQHHPKLDRMKITTIIAVIPCLVAPLIACGQSNLNQKAPARVAAKSEQSIEAFPEQPDDGLLTLNAVIQLPDGSPAANALMEQHQGQCLPRRQSIVRADGNGRVTLRDVFADGAFIHVRSGDSLFQATFEVDAQATRFELAKPVVIKLLPCATHRVIVDFEGKPVSDVHVIAMGNRFKVRGKTSPDGIVDLKIPPDDQLTLIDAWDPDRAVAKSGPSLRGQKSDSTRLSLQSPSPFLLRAIDPEGKPAVGVDLGLDFILRDGEWAGTRYFPGAHVRTDERGEANMKWVPEEKLQHVIATVVGSNWAIEDEDDQEISDRIVTLKVRRQKIVPGRLKMPDGVSAQGILLKSRSFGSGNRSTLPSTRARADGSFELSACSDFGFVIGPIDREWTGKPWTGLIIARDDDEPATIEIPIEQATPVTVRVTAGLDGKPQAAIWIEMFDQEREVSWINSQGKKSGGIAQLYSILRTNSDGIAIGGATRGKIKVRAVVEGVWWEGKELKVESAEPIEIHFHRP